MDLGHEVDASRQDIRSDGYMMSIGEVVNLYKDREIIIRPEFQRLFRWSLEQQSRLIESILLDIPLPPIFVAQREDGVWEVVDGLQRLSTILQFMGELRNEATGELLPASQLLRTKYLPSLEGATYIGGPKPFPPNLRVGFKRGRLDFRILLKESDQKVKYELFDRLNSGGAPTSPQEVRSAQLLMSNPQFYGWLDKRRLANDFQDCVPLTERQMGEQYDFELVVRFFALRLSTEAELKTFPEIDTFLTDKIVELSQSEDFDYATNEATFAGVFQVLSAIGPEAFRRFDSKRGKSMGAFSVSAYEAVTLGVAAHLTSWLALDLGNRADKLRRCIEVLWGDPEFRGNSGGGVRATTRVPKMQSVGSRIFGI
jgi:hypothetical protein